MTAIIIPRRHHRQPLSAHRIDWANPLTMGLHSAVVAGNLRDLVSGELLTTVRPEFIVDVPDAAGVATDVRGTTTSGTVSLTVPASGLSTRSFTFAAGINRVSGNGVGGRAGLSNILLWHVSGQWDLRLGGTNYTQAGIANPETWYDIAITGSPSAARLYVDGEAVIAGGAPAAGTMSDFVLGSDPGGGGSWNAAFTWLAFWRRDLSAEELAEVRRNPWQLFRAEPLRIYSLPSTGTEQAIAASGTATASATAQLAASIALAGVGVALASGSGTLSGTQSAPIAADGAATASGTAAPRIDITLSALGLAVATGTATPDAATAGSLAASGAATATGSAGQVASVTIAAEGLAQAAATAGLSANILRAGAGAAQAAGNAALAAQLAALAQGAAQASGTASIAATSDGSLLAAGGATASGTAALVLEVRLQAAGSSAASGSAAPTTGTAGSLDAPGAGLATGAAQLSAIVTLTAAGFAHAMGAGAVTLQVPLAAFGSAEASGTAVIYQPPALLRLAATAQRIGTLLAGVRPVATLTASVRHV
ncbi:hypothetical protein CGK74_13650 [Thauera propionica]|uniref:LamG-like jellyroll fold domain-containing protein n=2 Tax=Thauera propionica TaxID=2019431 RepID=A0A235EW74_9RHOO|nr:hypothetical protein CGK74_13650 [Thauera propionica]